MADRQMDTAKAREELFKCVDGKLTRKQLIRKSVEGLLDKNALEDTTPSSEYNNVCSLLGNVLDALIRDGYIKQDETTRAMCLCPEEKPEKVSEAKSGAKSDKKSRKPSANSNGKKAKEPENKAKTKQKSAAQEALERANLDAEIEAQITDIAKGGKCTRTELLDLIQKNWEKTGKQDAKKIRGRAGELLSKMKSAGVLIVEKNSGRYRLLSKKENKDYIDLLSGEAFNIHTQRMLVKWYEQNGVYVDLESKNTDGPNDNGIDCFIKGEDKMGFKEYIVIQCKHRVKSDINLKDMREFAGIMAFHLMGDSRSVKARPTKFLYVTNSKLTKDAQRYISSLPFGQVLKIVDGGRWLKLASECGYEIGDYEKAGELI